MLCLQMRRWRAHASTPCRSICPWHDHNLDALSAIDVIYASPRLRTPSPSSAAPNPLDPCPPLKQQQHCLLLLPSPSTASIAASSCRHCCFFLVDGAGGNGHLRSKRKKYDNKLTLDALSAQEPTSALTFPS